VVVVMVVVAVVVMMVVAMGIRVERHEVGFNDAIVVPPMGTFHFFLPHKVTVISTRNHFLFTPLLPSTTVGTLEFRSVTSTT